MLFHHKHGAVTLVHGHTAGSLVDGSVLEQIQQTSLSRSRSASSTGCVNIINGVQTIPSQSKQQLNCEHEQQRGRGGVSPSLHAHQLIVMMRWESLIMSSFPQRGRAEDRLTICQQMQINLKPRRHVLTSGPPIAPHHCSSSLYYPLTDRHRGGVNVVEHFITNMSTGGHRSESPT